MRSFFYALAILCTPTLAGAQAVTAYFFNPPGATDNGHEYIQIQGAASTTYTDLTLIVIEGQNTVAGIVDQVISLSGQTTGSNGMLLIRDAATPLSPTCPAETNVFIHDFSPDLENPPATVLLVTGSTASVNQDLDTNNDGVLDVTPWNTVLNAVGFTDGSSTSRMYAGQFGGTNLPRVFPNSVDAFVFVNGAYYAVDVSNSSTNPGPYAVGVAWNSSGTVNSSLAGMTIMPGGTQALPVELLSFKAVGKENQVDLAWTTLSERNNDFFAVEHSTNGLVFSEIGRMDGAGNSQSRLDYAFSHAKPTIGRNYYRLRQTDFDGRSALSPVRLVIFEQAEKLNVTPSLAISEINIQWPTNENDATLLEIVSMNGQIVFSQSFDAGASNALKLPILDFLPGVYVVRLQQGNRQQAVRFVKN